MARRGAVGSGEGLGAVRDRLGSPPRCGTRCPAAGGPGDTSAPVGSAPGCPRGMRTVKPDTTSGELGVPGSTAPPADARSCPAVPGHCCAPQCPCASGRSARGPCPAAAGAGRAAARRGACTLPGSPSTCPSLTLLLPGPTAALGPGSPRQPLTPRPLRAPCPREPDVTPPRTLYSAQTQRLAGEGSGTSSCGAAAGRGLPGHRGTRRVGGRGAEAVPTPCWVLHPFARQDPREGGDRPPGGSPLTQCCCGRGCSPGAPGARGAGEVTPRRDRGAQGGVERHKGAQGRG